MSPTELPFVLRHKSTNINPNKRKYKSYSYQLLIIYNLHYLGYHFLILFSIYSDNKLLTFKTQPSSNHSVNTHPAYPSTSNIPSSHYRNTNIRLAFILITCLNMSTPIYFLLFYHPVI